MNIEELVKKHVGHHYDAETDIRAALTELSETHAIELRAYEATVENLEQRIRELEAERDGMALVPRELMDKFPELNTSNYGHDDVDELNSWGIELYLAAAPQPNLKPKQEN